MSNSFYYMSMWKAVLYFNIPYIDFDRPHICDAGIEPCWN